MRESRFVAAATLALGSFIASGGALARPTVISAFTNSNNTPGWTYGGPFESIWPTQGNPDWHLRSLGLDTFAPQARTGWGVDSFWTGDYRLRNVQRIGVDLVTLDVDFSAGGRPLSLMLVSDNGTPNDFDDDWAAYTVGTLEVPVPGEGWRRFVFDVPTRATAAPAGWLYQQFGPSSPANPDWNTLMQDVAQVRFFYGDPSWLFIFQMWDVGLDNGLVAYCPYDTNGDGRTDFFELNSVLSDFGQVNAPPAPLSNGDVNGDGVVNFQDLNIVLSRFGQNCG